MISTNDGELRKVFVILC